MPVDCYEVLRSIEDDMKARKGPGIFRKEDLCVYTDREGFAYMKVDVEGQTFLISVTPAER